MKVCSSVPSNNRNVSYFCANIAKDFNRVALPIIATIAFASVLSVAASLDYKSCIAACNTTALAETRHDTCMRLCQSHLRSSLFSMLGTM